MPTLIEGNRPQTRTKNDLEIRVRVSPPPSAGQRRHMLIALGLLLLALAIVVVRDWPLVQAWISPPQPTSRLSNAAPSPDVAEPPMSSPSIAANTKAVPKKTAVSAPAETKPAAADTVPAVVATNRTLLPPLEVEVVAGSHRRTLRPGTNSVHVDLQSENAPAQVDAAAPAQDSGPVANAAEKVRLSPDTLQVLSRPVEPSYPLLARQMKVQGSVVLQALIGKSGNIQDLQVLSGPAILSTAAMEAVRQWHFRPYYVQGETTETQARITVNFTISTN
jgi:periplasmic protein TonB